MRIYTIGHSNITLEKFVQCLQSFDIQKLIDVRSHPGSRYVPCYNKENLMQTLPAMQIEYSHFPQLGGRRKSCNLEDYDLVEGWKNTSFKNYASYTLTREYEEGIHALIKEAKHHNICIMCAESVPWKCHRLLISNTLTLRGLEVFHIMDKGECILHSLNKYGAKAEDKKGKLIYPKH